MELHHNFVRYKSLDRFFHRGWLSLVPRPIPSFSMLHAEKREGLVSEITCAMSIVTQQSSKIWPLNKATVLG